MKQSAAVHTLAGRKRISVEEYRKVAGKKGVRLAATPTRTKYNNRHVRYDEHTFDSGVECQEYKDLMWLYWAGHITRPQVHPVFWFAFNGVEIGSYEADFLYIWRDTGELFVLDVKSEATRTPLYKQNVQLMLALYGIKVREIIR